MAFIKVQKNNTYYKRFQVKFRRRREGKTDYYQRKRLILQRKNKYATPKWRFVVRRTNQKIICQVISSTIQGDKVKSSAESTELKRFGLNSGLSNYSSAYATGLLASRRLLKRLDQETKAKDSKATFSWANTFDLVKETTGEYFNLAELASSKKIETRPFTAFLDIGLARATNGNRVFAALKGAVDGGINIPHNDKIFPKYKDEKKGKSLLRDRIFGVHVQEYLEKFRKNKPKSGNTHQFSLLEKTLSDAKVAKYDELIKKVHAEIRKNPDRVKKERKPHKVTYSDKAKTIVTSAKKPYKKDRKLTNKERRDRVNAKIAKYAKERSKK